MRKESLEIAAALPNRGPHATFREMTGRPRKPPARQVLIDAARERLVMAALQLRPRRDRSLRLVAFKVATAALLLRLAETLDES